MAPAMSAVLRGFDGRVNPVLRQDVTPQFQHL